MIALEDIMFKSRQIPMLFTLVVIAFAFAFAFGCGGATVAPKGEESTPSSTKAKKAKKAKKVKEVDDPKVDEARDRCEKEIETSELQPPDLLGKMQIHSCLYAIRPQIAECSKGVEREVIIKMMIEKDGHISNTFATGDTSDSPEAQCVAKIVKEVTFPKFKGQTQQIVKYPFKLGE
jgi:hypothetical protein